MSKKLKEELRNRWTTEIDFEINRCLKKEDWRDKTRPNCRLAYQPFGFTGSGMVDYRGFPLRECLNYQYLEIIDFSFLQVISGSSDDYGFSRGLIGILNSKVRNCNFIGAELPANLSEEFISCNFQEASFNACRINADFINCNFMKSNMKDVLLRGKKFVKCVFDQVNFQKACFYFCHFESCTFEDAKFKKANFAESTFIDTQLTDDQIASSYFPETLKFK